MTSIKIGPRSVAEYIVEQDEHMNVRARKLAEGGSEPTGEVQELGRMGDITDIEVQSQVHDRLYGDSEYGSFPL